MMGAMSRFFQTVIACTIVAASLHTIAAETRNVARIGFIANTDPEKNPLHLKAFRDGLREKGFVVGENVVIKYRWVVGSFSQKPDFVSKLLGEGVDVIVAWGSAATAAAKQATSTVPVVMVAVSDPVGTGFVKTLAKPGGNITGVTNVSREIAGKWVELLLQIRPEMKRVAAIRNPANPASVLSATEVEKAAKALRLECMIVDVRTPDGIGPAFETMAQNRADAMIITGEPMFLTHRKRFADLAIKYRLPSTFIVNSYPDVGGFLSFGPDPKYLFRSAAHYVAKIIRGASPADLPVERPTVYQLTINAKTARAIGVKIPHAVVLGADRVIE